MTSEGKKRAAKANVLKLSILASLGLGILLAILIVAGVITTTIGAGIFAALIAGMLVMHGGGTEIASGISDHEMYQNQLEEEEKFKQEQAELGYHEDEEEEEEY